MLSPCSGIGRRRRAAPCSAAWGGSGGGTTRGGSSAATCWCSTPRCFRLPSSCPSPAVQPAAAPGQREAQPSGEMAEMHGSRCSAAIRTSCMPCMPSSTPARVLQRCHQSRLPQPPRRACSGGAPCTGWAAGSAGRCDVWPTGADEDLKSSGMHETRTCMASDQHAAQTCLKTRSQKGHFCSCSRLSTLDGPLVPPPPAPELHASNDDYLMFSSA